MIDSTIEISEEQDRWAKKEKAIQALMFQSQGKLLRAESAETAKDALFELAFYSIAQDHISGEKDMIEHGDTVWGDEIVTSKKNYDDIVQRGEWGSAKDEWWEVLGSPDFDKEFAEILGLPLDLAFEGEELLVQPNEEEEDKEKYYRKGDKWNNFVGSKVELVPDKTEPYIHPNIIEIQGNITAIGTL